MPVFASGIPPPAQPAAPAVRAPVIPSPQSRAALLFAMQANPQLARVWIQMYFERLKVIETRNAQGGPADTPDGNGA
jgi:hypothetical protein